MKARRKSPQGDTVAAAVISVRVQPRSSKNSITRQVDGSYKVRLTVPPVDGAANEALVKLLAKSLGVSNTSVVIESGHSSRDKRISLTGLNLEEINGLLNKESK